MPCCPEKGHRVYFVNNSGDIKIVSNYTGLDFDKVWNMGIFDYYGYLHDAVVWECSGTTEGKEYLERAYTMMQTEPDREKLHNSRLNGVIGGR